MRRVRVDRDEVPRIFGPHPALRATFPRTAGEGTTLAVTVVSLLSKTPFREHVV